MRPARSIIILIVTSILLLCIVGFVQTRRLACEPIPLWSQNLLPNAGLARSNVASALPDLWGAAAPGVMLRGPSIDGQGFDTDGDGRALQLIGIANAVETPVIAVRPGQTYCFSIRALTDSPVSATRLRVAFSWNPRPATPPDDNPPPTDARHSSQYQSNWQPIVQWTPATRDWTRIVAAFSAPPDATQLIVQITAASDDRIYLDAPLVLAGGTALPILPATPPPALRVLPWPRGATGALSFSFDWETAMGGLIHSRSVDDPYGDQDPVVRAMRMREGVTTTLRLFAPYQIRATYFANGYNFLLGNREARTFLGNPTYSWARTEQPYAWRTNAWTHTPWFGSDPHGTVQSDSGWYFGDLVPTLLGANQDIQSHTFSHMYAGFATPTELNADAAEWNRIAAEAQVPAAVALAFPWSGSAGISDTAWQDLEAAGISVVTRTNRSQRQYQLIHAEDVHCQAIPGHEAILACPDFYLTPRSAPQAIGLIDRAIQYGGVIDLWAHTEEVTTPEQIAAWGQVVQHAGQRQSDGTLWIAPLADIANWQRARDQLRITQVSAAGPTTALIIRVENISQHDLNRLTLEAPFALTHWEIDGLVQPLGAPTERLILDLKAGQTRELTLWR